MASFLKEELDDVLDNSELLTKRAEAKLRQQRERQYVGRQMAELQDDPRWCTYVQHLNALKEPHANRVVVLEKTLSGNIYLPTEDLAKHRFELIKEKATSETFDIAKNLVFQLVEQGKVVE